jgi:hypothetical protein
VLGDIRATHRAVEKLREKSAQRVMRYSRAVGEKRSKDKQYAVRASKDAVQAAKAVAEKVTVKFQKDSKAWASGLAEKFETGKIAFLVATEVVLINCMLSDICNSFCLDFSSIMNSFNF